MTTLVVSNYLEDLLINHVFRNISYTPPTSVFIALYTSDPTDADTGVEVSGGAYARQQMTAGFTVPALGACENAAGIVFPTATASWGLITHIGIRDALTGGNLLFHGELTPNEQVDTGDDFSIAAGALDVSLTGAATYFLLNALLDHVLNNNAFTSPTALYAALFSTLPAQDGSGGVELSGGGYARKEIVGGFDAPANGATANSSVESHGTATADWAEAVGGGLFDAATLGNLLLMGNLGTPVTVFTDDSFEWPAGSITPSID